jgi:integrase
VFPGPRGNHINLRNFRSREWHPALDAAGVEPRRIYDLRSTFASQALAAGVSVFELARIMGTSV